MGAGGSAELSPKAEPSESVFLLFQLNREQERLPSPLPAARRCLVLCLLWRAAAIKPLVISSRQRRQRGQRRVLAPICTMEKGSRSSQVTRSV